MVRRPDADRDHGVAVNQEVERLRVAEIPRRRPRQILLFALRPIDLGVRLRNGARRQVDARAEPRQREGRFCGVGLDLNVTRRTVVQLQNERVTDLLDAVEARDVPLKN